MSCLYLGHKRLLCPAARLKQGSYRFLQLKFRTFKDHLEQNLMPISQSQYQKITPGIEENVLIYISRLDIKCTLHTELSLYVSKQLQLVSQFFGVYQP